MSGSQDQVPRTSSAGVIPAVVATVVILGALALGFVGWLVGAGLMEGARAPAPPGSLQPVPGQLALSLNTMAANLNAALAIVHGEIRELTWHVATTYVLIATVLLGLGVEYFRWIRELPDKLSGLKETITSEAARLRKEYRKGDTETQEAASVRQVRLEQSCDTNHAQISGRLDALVLAWAGATGGRPQWSIPRDEQESSDGSAGAAAGATRARGSQTGTQQREEGT